MYDPVGFLFASVNVGLSILVLGIVAYGMNYFKEGLLAKTLSRARPAAVLLLLYFLTRALITMGLLLSNTYVDDVLGTLLVLSMIYLAYGYVNDWKNFQLAPSTEK